MSSYHQLVKQIAHQLNAQIQETSVPESEINRILRKALDIMAKTLEQGDEVWLVDFGHFTTQILKSRQTVSNLNGTSTIHQTPPRKRVIFKPSQSLKDRLSED